MKKVFEGDKEMYIGCQEEARRSGVNQLGMKFGQNAHLTDPIDITNAINFGEEVRDFLEINIIQVDSS